MESMETASWLVRFLNTPSVSRAVALALLSSLMCTQWVKYLLPGFLSDYHHRAIVMTFAAAVAFSVCLQMWPKGADAAIPMSLVIAFTSPVAYKVTMGVLYHFFPWLEPIFSSRPKS